MIEPLSSSPLTLADGKGITFARAVDDINQALAAINLGNGGRKMDKVSSGPKKAVQLAVIGVLGPELRSVLEDKGWSTPSIDLIVGRFPSMIRVGSPRGRGSVKTVVIQRNKPENALKDIFTTGFDG